MVRNYDLKLDAYNIPKARYRELKYFCLQYPDWKRELNSISSPLRAVSIDGMPKGKSGVSDQTGNFAVHRMELEHKCRIIETACENADKEIGKYILEAVTGDLSYTYLRTVRNIPCGKNEYYKARRKFFYHLSKMRDTGAID